MQYESKPGAVTIHCGNGLPLERRLGSLAWMGAILCTLAGCGHVIPIVGTIRGEGTASVTADANVRGAFEIKVPSSVDPGNMMCTVVRPGIPPLPLPVRGSP